VGQRQLFQEAPGFYQSKYREYYAKKTSRAEASGSALPEGLVGSGEGGGGGGGVGGGVGIDDSSNQSGTRRKARQQRRDAGQQRQCPVCGVLGHNKRWHLQPAPGGVGATATVADAPYKSYPVSVR
jgi:hypothetical protein